MYAKWISICLVLTLISCQKNEDKHDIRAYYFPVEALTEGQVYEYRPIQNDSLGPEYWYYKSYVSDTGTYFTGNFYDRDFVVRQFFTEEVVSNGTLMHSYFLYAFDSTGAQLRVPTEVLVPNVYPFEVRDSGGVFLFKLKWDSGGTDRSSTTLIRNRRYMGKTTYPFKGAAQDCVEFELKELVELYVESEGYAEPELVGKELYARNIGLIYYKKQLSGNQVLEYELADIYGMNELEAKFKKSLDEQNTR